MGCDGHWRSRPEGALTSPFMTIASLFPCNFCLRISKMPPKLKFTSLSFNL